MDCTRIGILCHSGGVCDEKTWADDGIEMRFTANLQMGKVVREAERIGGTPKLVLRAQVPNGHDAG